MGTPRAQALKTEGHGLLSQGFGREQGPTDTETLPSGTPDPATKSKLYRWGVW